MWLRSTWHSFRRCRPLHGLHMVSAVVWGRSCFTVVAAMVGLWFFAVSSGFWDMLDMSCSSSRMHLAWAFVSFAYTWCSMLCMLLGQPSLGTWLHHRLHQGHTSWGGAVCGLTTLHKVVGIWQSSAVSWFCSLCAATNGDVVSSSSCPFVCSAVASSYSGGLLAFLSWDGFRCDPHLPFLFLFQFLKRWRHR